LPITSIIAGLIVFAAGLLGRLLVRYRYRGPVPG
jgi:hypothetical protein